MVLEAGIEPAHPYGYRILSPVRLPVSPLQQQWPPGGTLASGSRSVKVAVEDGDRREIWTKRQGQAPPKTAEPVPGESIQLRRFDP